MSEPEQCIICLDSLPLPRASTATATATTAVHDDHLQAPLPSPPAAAAAAVTTTNGTATNTTTTTKTKTIDEADEEPLVVQPPPSEESPEAPPPAISANDSTPTHLDIVAALDGCNHIIHEACIRSWAQKTNTCPICRNTFHSVRVFNGIDGTAISTYDVEDRKQVAEFDFQQWLGEDHADEEPEQNRPCPICNSAEREDVLLLCDSCDAAYHTHCIGLDDIPDGDWYCMECRHLFQLADEPENQPDHVTTRETIPREQRASRPGRPRHVSRPTPRDARGYHVRTRARLRRARQQARNVEWQGAWGQFAGRFYDLSDVDLDNLDDEDEDLEQFRRFQQLDRRELHRWQQRMNIANRLGARDAFANTIPPQITEHLHSPPPPPPALAPPVEESRDERRAWGAFERAREAEEGTSSTVRKRKTRSVTASPAEPPVQEPERKLKRPRTRRLPTQQGEASGSASSPVTSAPPVVWTNGGSSTPAAAGAAAAGAAAGAAAAARSPVAPPGRDSNEPALVSSLLKELEPHAPSEDENGVTPAGAGGASSRRQPPDASSPVLSPSPSNHSSPRALSMTPPPLGGPNGRPTSPTLSLSTHIEPRYPPANYSPNRNRNRNANGSGSGSGSGSDHSDSEGRPSRREGRSRREGHQTLELRQPRPRRPHPTVPRVQETSPTRSNTMTQEEKKSINDIVKMALRPHWRAQKLTPEQYATINRDISRKLYEEVQNASSLDDDARRSWESRASQEVARAMAGLAA